MFMLKDWSKCDRNFFDLPRFKNKLDNLRLEIEPKVQR